jgi:hypothetical protein
MHERAIKLLKTMFRDGETICVSDSKYGYHSIPLENAWKDPVTLFSPNPEIKIQFVDSVNLNLVALNPIKGFREDLNCTAFRNFMVEMDMGPLAQQLQYIKASGMPYSAVIFSGSKSLHFLISLDTDLPNESIWRLFAEWTLNIVPLADPLTKNPSRSIRIPESYREPDKLQKLVEFHGPVKLDDFANWLRKWPSAKPVVSEKKKIKPGEFDKTKVKGWVIKALDKGIDRSKGRNAQWYAIACEFALAGYTEDGTMAILGDYFSPDRDFKEREWKTTIKSAFKRVYGKEQNEKG